MKNSYQKQFQKLEAKKDQLFEQLRLLDVTVQNKKRSEAEWSPLEVVQHLILVEQASLAYTKKKSSFPDKLLNAGAFGFVRIFLMYVLLYLPIKVKAPKEINESKFRKGALLEELMEEWSASRNALEAFLEEYPAEYYNKLSYKHPFAGRLTVDGMLTFVELHFDRHLGQINRSLK